MKNLCLKLRYPIARYKHWARNQSKRQFPPSHSYFKFADILFSLEVDYECLKLKGRKVTGATVAEAYEENRKYGISLMKQTAHTAKNLPKVILECMKQIVKRRTGDVPK